MKYLVTSLLAISLVGCHHNTKPQTETETVYICEIPPVTLYPKIKQPQPNVGPDGLLSNEGLLDYNDSLKSVEKAYREGRLIWVDWLGEKQKLVDDSNNNKEE